MVLALLQAAVERQKEDAAREEETEIAKWEAALTKIMDLRFEGVTDEDKWKEVINESENVTSDKPTKNNEQNETDETKGTGKGKTRERNKK